MNIDMSDAAQVVGMTMAAEARSDGVAGMTAVAPSIGNSGVPGAGSAAGTGSAERVEQSDPNGGAR